MDNDDKMVNANEMGNDEMVNDDEMNNDENGEIDTDK